MGTPNIIPKPTQMLLSKGGWVLDTKAKVGAPVDERWVKVAGILAGQINKASGYALKTTQVKGYISLFLSSGKSLGEEGYCLLHPKESAFRLRPRKVLFMVYNPYSSFCLSRFSVLKPWCM
jgi:hypothetical protein